MEKTIFIRDVAAGRSVEDAFVLAEAKLSQSRGGPYWNLVLQDISGRMEAKVWSPLSQQFTDLAPGVFVRVRGQAQTYRDKVQLTLDGLWVLDPQEAGLRLADFLPASAVPAEELLAGLEELLRENVRHKPLAKFCRKALADPEIRSRLLAATGAKSIHHAYSGGLLEHTLAVCRVCASLCDLYPSLDRQVLLTAAAFHDLGKAWELSSGLVSDYTDEGRLVGHIVIGLEKLEPHLRKAADLEPELVLHLKHIILAHHGEYEFGSPRRPKTPEAFALHLADNLDAKLNTIAGAMAETPEDQRWSPYQRSLERFLYRPARTPDDKAPDRQAKKDQNQCSLPLKG